MSDKKVSESNKKVSIIQKSVESKLKFLDSIDDKDEESNYTDASDVELSDSE